MNGLTALKQYQQMGAHSGVMDASPHRLIQMLLDGALSRILSAKASLRQNNIAKKGEQIGGAISIIEMAPPICSPFLAILFCLNEALAGNILDNAPSNNI